MSIPQMDGGNDESPKRNRSKFPPLNIIKSPKRPNSGKLTDSFTVILALRSVLVGTRYSERLN